MRSLFIGFLLFSIFGITSCITAKLESRKDPNFNEKLEKVYIIMKGADQSNKFFNYMRQLLGEEFRKRQIQHDFYVYDKLSLVSDEEIFKKVDTYDPQVLMTINQTERVTTVGGYYSAPAAAFDVQIQKKNADQMAWRATLKTQTVSNLSEGAAKSVEKLIRQLEEDGLIEKSPKE